MKKIILTILISIFSVLYICGTPNNIETINEISNIENVNTIKLYTPAIVRIIDNPDDSTLFKVITTDSYINKYLEYEIKDSIMKIMLKSYDINSNWDIESKDIRIYINNKHRFKISTSNDLVIFNEKNIQELNHENTQN